MLRLATTHPLQDVTRRASEVHRTEEMQSIMPKMNQPEPAAIPTSNQASGNRPLQKEVMPPRPPSNAFRSDNSLQRMNNPHFASRYDVMTGHSSMPRRQTLPRTTQSSQGRVRFESAVDRHGKKLIDQMLYDRGLLTAAEVTPQPRQSHESHAYETIDDFSTKQRSQEVTRCEHVADQRRSTNAKDGQRRSTNAKDDHRRSTNAAYDQGRSTNAKDGQRRSTNAEDDHRRSTNAEDGHRRSTNAEDSHERPKLVRR